MFVESSFSTGNSITMTTLDDIYDYLDKGERAIVSIVFGVLGCGTLAAAGIVYLVYLSHADKSQTSKAPEERSDSDQQ